MVFSATPFSILRYLRKRSIHSEFVKGCPPQRGEVRMRGEEKDAMSFVWTNTTPAAPYRRLRDFSFGRGHPSSVGSGALFCCRSQFPSSQRRGGCGINEKTRSYRSAAAGVVRSAEGFRLKHFAELTTPAAPFQNGSILWMARPPLLCEEIGRAHV